MSDGSSKISRALCPVLTTYSQPTVKWNFHNCVSQKLLDLAMEAVSIYIKHVLSQQDEAASEVFIIKS